MMGFPQKRTASLSDNAPPPYQYTTVDDDQSVSSQRSSESATRDTSEDAQLSSGHGAQQSKASAEETIKLRPMLEGQPATFKRPKDPEMAKQQSRRSFSFFARWRRALWIILAAAIFLVLAVAVPIIVLKR
jgi:hypothetical protein